MNMTLQPNSWDDEHDEQTITEVSWNNTNFPFDPFCQRDGREFTWLSANKRDVTKHPWIGKKLNKRELVSPISTVFCGNLYQIFKLYEFKPIRNIKTKMCAQVCYMFYLEVPLYAQQHSCTHTMQYI